MTLASPKYIEHIHAKNKAVIDFTLQEICHYTGVPFKQVDTWIREGLLPNYSITTKGSGHHRIFSYDAAFMLALLAQINKIGLGTQRLRDITKVVYPIIEDPYGIVLIDLDDIENTKHAQTGISDLSMKIKEHLRYSTASPLMVIDVDKIHLNIDNWWFDCQLRRELQTAYEILGEEIRASSLSRMVEPIEDLDEYLRGKRKPGRSRFRN